MRSRHVSNGKNINVSKIDDHVDGHDDGGDWQTRSFPGPPDEVFLLNPPAARDLPETKPVSEDRDPDSDTAAPDTAPATSPASKPVNASPIAPH